MAGKIQKSLITIILIFFLISSNNIIADSNPDFLKADLENYSSKKEIQIPIDTSTSEAEYQPVDTRVSFENSCWALNETIHSVRVGYDDGLGLTELDVQLYDLEFSDNNNLKSCSIVFLIPEYADGKEKYFLFYDSDETQKPDYKDHLIIEDTHYFYEPISGQKIDFDYYGIKEDGYVIYAVIQKGEMLGNPVGQNVGKFKPGSTEVETYNLDQLASFAMEYGIYDNPGYAGTSWGQDVKKEIIVDGNLMIRVRVGTQSLNHDIKTDNIYTYYYSPVDTKRIIVNAHHEVLKTVNIQDPEFYDGSYAGITSIKSRSATIEKMNVGEILPKIYVYTDKDVVNNYDVPQNPDTIKKQGVLNTEADIDLGTKAWMSLSDPTSGKAHGMILESTTGLTQDEYDGIQLKAWVKQNIKFTGLEADTGSVYMMRNAYEKDSGHNTVLSEGFITNYNIEFLTTEIEGFEKIDKESIIFQSLIKNIPIRRDNVTDEEEIEKYTLKAKIHIAPSFPLGTLLSAVTGRNLSYIYTELFLDNSFKSSGAVSRISLGDIELDLENKTLLEKIKTILGIFNWKNASFYKKIIFPGLEQGKYVIKIFKENPFLAKERQYIGFAVVEVSKNTEIDIYCRIQGNVQFDIKDQDKKGIENARIIFESQGEIIAESFTNKNGLAELKAPSIPTKPYKMKVYYQGFLIDEKEIKLGFINRFKEVTQSYSIKQYSINLNVVDNWNFPPDIEINPTLTSANMANPIFIQAEKIKEGEYQFKHIYPSDYSLIMSYKSYETEVDVSIKDDMTLDLVFPAEYKVDFLVMDSYGQQTADKKIKISRNSKNVMLNAKDERRTSISIPPGEYEISVLSDDEVIGKQIIQVRGEKNVDIVTKEGSILHLIITLLGVILSLYSFFIVFRKKQLYKGLKLLVVAFIIFALFSSWWVLNGDDGTTSTSTNTYLFPSKIVSITESYNIVGGEVSQVPEEVAMVLNLLFILLSLTGFVLIGSILTINKKRKTTILFSILSIILIILTIFLFIYTMSQLTELGIGSFIGDGDIEIGLPGIGESKTLSSSWGPGIGFYLVIISLIILFGISIYPRIRKKLK